MSLPSTLEPGEWNVNWIFQDYSTLTNPVEADLLDDSHILPQIQTYSSTIMQVHTLYPLNAEPLIYALDRSLVAKPDILATLSTCHNNCTPRHCAPEHPPYFADPFVTTLIHISTLAKDNCIHAL